MGTRPSTGTVTKVVDRITSTSGNLVNAYTGPPSEKLTILGALVASDPIIQYTIEWINNQNGLNARSIRDMMNPHNNHRAYRQRLKPVDTMVNGAKVNHIFVVDTRIWMAKESTSTAPTPAQWAERFPHVRVTPSEITNSSKRALCNSCTVISDPSRTS